MIKIPAPDFCPWCGSGCEEAIANIREGYVIPDGPITYHEPDVLTGWTLHPCGHDVRHVVSFRMAPDEPVQTRAVLTTAEMEAFFQAACSSFDGEVIASG